MATTGAPPHRSTSERGLQAMLNRAVSSKVLPGAVVGLCWPDGGRTVAAAGHGRGIPGPLRPDHRFLLTSVTKVLTATQVLETAASHLLDVDAPVATYLPEFATNGKDAVTTMHLLTHTSGIDSTSCNGAEDPSATSPGDELYADVCQAGLAAAPGSRVEYCSPAFWVLAALVHRLTGLRHDVHLTERVLAPRGLHDTRYEPGAQLPERYVLPWLSRYDALSERVRRLAYPAGGVVGTADDLLRLGRSYLANDDWPVRGFAFERTASTVGLPGTRSPSQGTWRTERSAGWALGGPGRTAHGRLLWHNGASGTSWWVDPVRGVVVVLLTASWYLPPNTIGRLLDGALDVMDHELGPPAASGS